MPEGDTLNKLARALDSGLAGHRVEAAELYDLAGIELVGRKIEGARAVGKHLWIDFANEPDREGGSLRSHLGMHGSWHRYDVGEPWAVQRRRASLELVVQGSVWVLFAASELEWMRGAAAKDESLDGRLGPDLIEGVPAANELWRRALGECGDRALLVDVLLEQRVACGLGNVYKSELLFLFEHGVRTRLDRLDAPALHAVYARGHELLLRNLGSGPRTTRFREDGRGRVWVYRRQGKPCLRCGTPIERGLLGRRRRSTYWCPQCQRSY